MQTRAAVVAAALATTSLLAARVEAGETPYGVATDHWLCIASDDPHTSYYSNVFDVQGDRGEVDNAFAQALAAKYGYKGEAPCAVYPVSGPQSADNTRAMQIAQDARAGKKAVELDWSYQPGAVSLPYVCYANIRVQKAGQSTNYLYATPEFRLAGNNGESLRDAWRAHQIELHPGFRAAEEACELLPADDAKRSERMTALANRWHMDQLSVVHDDWKFTGAPNVADRGQAYLCELLTSDGKTWYVTPVVPAPAGFDTNAASDQFRAYAHTTLGLNVQETYHGGCVANTYAQREQYRAARKEQLEATAGVSIKDLSWTYAPKSTSAGAGNASATDRYADNDSPTAAAPKPQQATASAPKLAQPANYVCHYDVDQSGRADHVEKIRYMARPFTSAAALVDVTAAWRSYIADQYHPGAGSGNCNATSMTTVSPQLEATGDIQLKAMRIAPIHLDWKPSA